MEHLNDPVERAGDGAVLPLRRQRLGVGVELAPVDRADIQLGKYAVIDVVAQVGLAEALAALGHGGLQKEPASGAGGDGQTVRHQNVVQPDGDTRPVQPDAQGAVVLFVDIELGNKGLGAVRYAGYLDGAQPLQVTGGLGDTLLVLVVGEGPGEMEDRSGRPFVGPAGQLLDKMLAAISLSRTTTCHIANIVKCRPPHNRDPYPDEEDACIAYLEAPIHILKPKVILAMGNIAAKKLLNTTEGISRLRGRFYDYRGIPLTATFHPSALLHSESLKRPAWDDLKFLRTWLESQQPGYENAFMQAQQAMQTQQTQDTGPAAEPQ